MPGNLTFFRDEITGISNAGYVDTKQMQFGFSAGNVRVRYISGTIPIFFSFNGADDSGEVGFSMGRSDVELFRDIRSVHTIHFRGGDGTETLSVEAW